MKKINALKKQYKEIEKFYGDLSESLDRAIFDLELINNGWIVHFAVDFHEVFEFAFPLETLPRFRYRKKLFDSEKMDIIEKRAMLTYLFYELKYSEKTIFLFSPHIMELRNKIIFEQMNVFKRELVYKNLREFINNLLNENENLIIKNAYSWYKDHRYETLPPDLYRNLSKIVFNKFLNVLLLTSGVTINGLKTIHELIKDSNLTLKPKEEYKELIENVINSPNSKYYTLFSNLRNKPDSNYRDAKLIDIMMALNEEYRKNNRKEIIYLVSSAFFIKTVLSLDGKIDYPLNKENTIYRHPNIFLAYLLNSGKNLDETIENLKNMQSEIVDFSAPPKHDIVSSISTKKIIEELIENCNGNCKECQYSSLCKIIKNKLNKHWRKYKSLRILLERSLYVAPVLKSIKDLKAEENIEEFTKALVLFLNEGNEELDYKIRKKEGEVRKIINALNKELKEKGIEYTAIMIENIVHKYRVLLGMPFPVNFYNEKIKKAVKDLEISIEERRAMDEIKDNLTKLIDLVGDHSIGDERKFLWAILLHCNNFFKEADKLLSDLILKPDIEHKEEYILVRCLNLHQWGIQERIKEYYNNAKKLCQENLQEHKDDLRFHYLVAVIIGRGVEAYFEEKHAIKDVIEGTHRAYEICIKEGGYGTYFEATLLNTIAYAYTLKPDLTPKDIELAWDYLKKIKISPKEWLPHFTDTKACVFYHKARFEKDIKKKKEYIEESIKLSNEAMELAEQNDYPRFKIEIYQKNLQRAEAYE